MVGREALLVLVAVTPAEIFFVFPFFAAVEGDECFVGSWTGTGCGAMPRPCEGRWPFCGGAGTEGMVP